MRSCEADEVSASGHQIEFKWSPLRKFSPTAMVAMTASFADAVGEGRLEHAPI